MRYLDLRILVPALVLSVSLVLIASAADESTEPDLAPATKEESPKAESSKAESSKTEKAKTESDDEPEAEPTNKVAKEFKRIKTRLQSQIRSKTADISVPAVEEITKYPCFEAGKFLFSQGKDLPCHDARQAALVGMLGLINEDGVRPMVMRAAESMLKPLSGKSGKPSSDAVYALVILLAGPDDGLDSETQALMDKLEASPGWPALFIPMADMLGPVGGPQAAAVLRKLTKTTNFAGDFGFRRAVVQNLGIVKQKDAISTLIELLDSTRGQIHADILGYLKAISFEKYNKKHEWLRWWEEEKDRFEFPDPEEMMLKPQVVLAAGPGVVGAAGQGPNYYGLPLYGSRMVFVMDTSGSMRGPRIDAAKRELMKALSELPDGIHFNVLVFDVNVRPWQKVMTLSTPESRTDAAAYIFRQELGNGTASSDALDAAMKFDTEAIFFVTDGVPFGGRIPQPARIVQEVTKTNRRRRISVHTIGIGAGMIGSDMDVFLATLAGQNWGAYRRVDE
jgi:hypothetical protein